MRRRFSAVLFIGSIFTVLFEHVIEHAQRLTGYYVFMVSGLDFARAPRRAPLTTRKKGFGYENGAPTNNIHLNHNGISAFLRNDHSNIVSSKSLKSMNSCLLYLSCTFHRFWVFV
jgi:hypothetical protein